MAIKYSSFQGRPSSFFVTVAATVVVVGLPAVSHADSISPSSYNLTLDIGSSSTINKAVTISRGTPTSAVVDVLFLTDTTGSMGPTIAGVRSQFATIVTDLAPLGDVAFGAAQYKDSGDTLSVNGAYKLDQNITKNTALVQSAFGTYAASGGGDIPEANLFALDRAAGATWRPGSTRFIVWTGDAAGHDKIFGVDKGLALTSLNGQNIRVIGINQNSGPGLDVAFSGMQVGQAGDIANASAGQASFITAGTGGQYFPTATTSQIENIVKNAINSTFNQYSSVCIDSTAAPLGVSVTHAGCVTGSFDRSVDRTFNFSTTFTGTSVGTYDFSITAKVDGGIVATELDHVAVVPEPVTQSLMLAGLLMLTLAIRTQSDERTVEKSHLNGSRFKKIARFFGN